MNFSVRHFEREDEWIASVLERIEGLAEVSAGAGHSDFHLCLSGGGTPAPVYRALAASPRLARLSEQLQFHAWLGDERVVPSDSPQRNGRMIAEALGLGDSGTGHSWQQSLRFHPWPEDSQETACEAYDRELRNTFSSVLASPLAAVFDIVILGMGTDGHTAGLFSLADCERPELTLATLAPAEPRLRMTMGSRLLTRTGECMVLARGRDKQAVLDLVLAGADFPLTRVAGHESGVYLLNG